MKVNLFFPARFINHFDRISPLFKIIIREQNYITASAQSILDDPFQTLKSVKIYINDFECPADSVLLYNTDYLMSKARIQCQFETVKDIEKQYERIESRLVLVEKRYRAQFTAMDTAVANMQGLSSYVTQLLNMSSDSSS